MQWSQTNETEAEALLPENNMQDGEYWATVTSQKEIPGGRLKDDGTTTMSFWKFYVTVETPTGKCPGEFSIFDTPRMFFVRKHFWESCGEPEKINASPEEYVGKRIKAFFKVERYQFNGEERKKYVTMNFIVPVKEEKFIEDDIKF